MVIENTLTFMLDQLTRSSGWNRISDSIKGEAVEVLVELMRNPNLPPGDRIRAVDAMMRGTKLGIDSVNSMVRIVEAQILSDRIRQLEELVKESNPGRELPPLPGYDLPDY
jgi:hypothetical protein